MYIQCIVTRIILNCLLNYLIKEPRSSHLFWGRGVCIPASFSMHRSIPQIILAMRHHFILHFICCENDIKTYIFYRVFPLVSQVFWSIINHSWEYSVAFCFAFFSLFQTILYSMRRIANSYAIKSKPIKAQNRVPTRYILLLFHLPCHTHVSTLTFYNAYGENKVLPEN